MDADRQDADQQDAVPKNTEPVLGDKPVSQSKSVKSSRAERLEAKAARLREAGGGRRRDRLGWLLVAAGIVIVALAVALSVVAVQLGHRDDQLTRANRAAAAQSQLQSLRDSALTSAKKYAVDFGSYDYSQLDHDFQLVSSHLTKSFAAKYARISQQLKGVIVKYQGKSTATVQGAGVSSVSGKQAVVVLFLDQTVTTTQSDKPRVDRNRLTMTLQRQPDGTWRISDMELV